MISTAQVVNSFFFLSIGGQVGGYRCECMSAEYVSCSDIPKQKGKIREDKCLIMMVILWMKQIFFFCFFFAKLPRIQCSCNKNFRVCISLCRMRSHAFVMKVDPSRIDFFLYFLAQGCMPGHLKPLSKRRVGLVLRGINSQQTCFAGQICRRLLRLAQFQISPCKN